MVFIKYAHTLLFLSKNSKIFYINLIFINDFNIENILKVHNILQEV